MVFPAPSHVNIKKMYSQENLWEYKTIIVANVKIEWTDVIQGEI